MERWQELKETCEEKREGKRGGTKMDIGGKEKKRGK